MSDGQYLSWKAIAFLFTSAWMYDGAQNRASAQPFPSHMVMSAPLRSTSIDISEGKKGRSDSAILCEMVLCLYLIPSGMAGIERNPSIPILKALKISKRSSASLI